MAKSLLELLKEHKFIGKEIKFDMKNFKDPKKDIPELLKIFTVNYIVKQKPILDAIFDDKYLVVENVFADKTRYVWALYCKKTHIVGPLEISEVKGKNAGIKFSSIALPKDIVIHTPVLSSETS